MKNATNTSGTEEKNSIQATALSKDNKKLATALLTAWHIAEKNSSSSRSNDAFSAKTPPVYQAKWDLPKMTVTYNTKKESGDDVIITKNEPVDMGLKVSQQAYSESEQAVFRCVANLQDHDLDILCQDDQAAIKKVLSKTSIESTTKEEASSTRSSVTDSEEQSEKSTDQGHGFSEDDGEGSEKLTAENLDPVQGKEGYAIFFQNTKLNSLQPGERKTYWMMLREVLQRNAVNPAIGAQFSGYMNLKRNALTFETTTKIGQADFSEKTTGIASLGVSGDVPKAMKSTLDGTEATFVDVDTYEANIEGKRSRTASTDSEGIDDGHQWMRLRMPSDDSTGDRNSSRSISSISDISFSQDDSASTWQFPKPSEYKSVITSLVDSSAVGAKQESKMTLKTTEAAQKINEEYDAAINRQRNGQKIPGDEVVLARGKVTVSRGSAYNTIGQGGRWSVGFKGSNSDKNQDVKKVIQEQNKHMDNLVEKMAGVQRVRSEDIVHNSRTQGFWQALYQACFPNKQSVDVYVQGVKEDLRKVLANEQSLEVFKQKYACTDMPNADLQRLALYAGRREVYETTDTDLFNKSFFSQIIAPKNNHIFHLAAATGMMKSIFGERAIEGCKSNKDRAAMIRMMQMAIDRTLQKSATWRMPSMPDKVTHAIQKDPTVLLSDEYQHGKSQQGSYQSLSQVGQIDGHGIQDTDQAIADMQLLAESFRELHYRNGEYAPYFSEVTANNAVGVTGALAHSAPGVASDSKHRAMMPAAFVEIYKVTHPEFLVQTQIDSFAADFNKGPNDKKLEGAKNEHTRVRELYEQSLAKMQKKIFDQQTSTGKIKQADNRLVRFFASVRRTFFGLNDNEKSMIEGKLRELEFNVSTEGLAMHEVQQKINDCSSGYELQAQDIIEFRRAVLQKNAWQQGWPRVRDAYIDAHQQKILMQQSAKNVLGTAPEEPLNALQTMMKPSTLSEKEENEWNEVWTALSEYPNSSLKDGLRNAFAAPEKERLQNLKHFHAKLEKALNPKISFDTSKADLEKAYPDNGNYERYEKVQAKSIDASWKYGEKSDGFENNIETYVKAQLEEMIRKQASNMETFSETASDSQAELMDHFFSYTNPTELQQEKSPISPEDNKKLTGDNVDEVRKMCEKHQLSIGEVIDIRAKSLKEKLTNPEEPLGKVLRDYGDVTNDLMVQGIALRTATLWANYMDETRQSFMQALMDQAGKDTDSDGVSQVLKEVNTMLQDMPLEIDYAQNPDRERLEKNKIPEVFLRPESERAQAVDAFLRSRLEYEVGAIFKKIGEGAQSASASAQEINNVASPKEEMLKRIEQVMSDYQKILTPKECRIKSAILLRKLTEARYAKGDDVLYQSANSIISKKIGTDSAESAAKSGESSFDASLKIMEALEKSTTREEAINRLEGLNQEIGESIEKSSSVRGGETGKPNSEVDQDDRRPDRPSH